MKACKMIAVFSFIVVSAGLMFCSAGCTVKKSPPFGAAEFVTTPPGADVIDLKDNSMLGTTPFKYVLETEEGNAEYVTVKITKPGYADKTYSFFIHPQYMDEEGALQNPQSIEVNLQQKQ